MGTSPLQRHDLVRLAPQAWRDLRPDQAHLERAAELIALWAAHGWPLIVTRQDADFSTDQVALGLPAPRGLGRVRLRLTVPLAAIAAVDALPELKALLCRLGAPAGGPTLDHALRERGLTAQVFGSFAWQALTGLDYVHDRSDLDLAIRVSGWSDAEAAVAVLAKAQLSQRLDGELVFPGHRAVAWREIAQLSSGQVDSVLVKRLDGVALAGRSELAPTMETPG
jgi:phosphoribosyl-dephospho-CoA transferase